MKNFLKYFCLFLIFLLPLTTNAKFIGEVFFLDNGSNDLLITPINNTDRARVFYQREPRELIWELSVQKNGPLIALIANVDDSKPLLNSAVYIININDIPLKMHRLTPDKFNFSLNIDISQNGDIIFTNHSIFREAQPERKGIYLIPHHELKKASPKIRAFPKITLLKETDARRVGWSPNGKQIAYDTIDSIYIFNLRTKRSSKVHQGGRYPAFSPDGSKLAFAHYDLGEDEPREIRVISLITPGRPDIFKLKEHSSFNYLKWSPDGKFLVYSVFVKSHGDRIFAIPFNGGPHEEILTIDPGNDRIKSIRSFDWAPSAYAVEPINRLTTLWGKIKTENTK